MWSAYSIATADRRKPGARQPTARARAAGGRPRPPRRAAPRPARCAARCARSRAGAPPRAARRRRAPPPRPGERRRLGVDVERRLAASHAPRRLRLEHLADLRLAPRRAPPRCPAAGPPRRSGSSSENAPCPIAVVDGRRPNSDHDRDHDGRPRPRRSARCRRRPPRTYSLTMWRRLRRRTMAPSRPASSRSSSGSSLLSRRGDRLRRLRGGPGLRWC